MESQGLLIKEWKIYMDSRKEVLGSNIVRKERIGDRIISILHNRESGAILFYANQRMENIYGQS